MCVYIKQENELTMIAGDIGNGPATSSKGYHIMASFTFSEILLRTFTFYIAQVYAACGVVGWC